MMDVMLRIEDEMRIQVHWIGVVEVVLNHHVQEDFWDGSWFLEVN